MKLKSWRAPVEVKIVSLTLPGIGVAWVLVVLLLVLLGSESAVRTFLPSGTSAVLGGLVAAGVLLRMASARIVGFGVVGLFALLHAFVVISAELLWIKLFSGACFAAYVYSGVLLNSMPLRRHVIGANA